MSTSTPSQRGGRSDRTDVAWRDAGSGCRRIRGVHRLDGAGAYLLYRIDGEIAEFLTFSLWDSLEVIEAFAGKDVERAVFYPQDDRYLVERDLTARHYVVAGSATPVSSTR
jgi:heme-degrading monooxygenase HmoA